MAYLKLYWLESAQIRYLASNSTLLIIYTAGFLLLLWTGRSWRKSKLVEQTGQLLCTHPMAEVDSCPCHMPHLFKPVHSEFPRLWHLRKDTWAKYSSHAIVSLKPMPGVVWWLLNWETPKLQKVAHTSDYTYEYIYINVIIYEYEYISEDMEV